MIILARLFRTYEDIIREGDFFCSVFYKIIIFKQYFLQHCRRCSTTLLNDGITTFFNIIENSWLNHSLFFCLILYTTTYAIAYLDSRRTRCFLVLKIEHHKTEQICAHRGTGFVMVYDQINALTLLAVTWHVGQRLVGRIPGNVECKRCLHRGLVETRECFSRVHCFEVRDDQRPGNE